MKELSLTTKIAVARLSLSSERSEHPVVLLMEYIVYGFKDQLIEQAEERRKKKPGDQKNNWEGLGSDRS